VKQTIVGFGLLIAAILALLKISEYTYLSGSLDTELILGGIAIAFFVLGTYLNKKMNPPKEIVIDSAKENFVVDEAAIIKLEITKREYEVLESMNKGHSNQGIAEELFLSESTVKTHVSSLLVKLDAQRRTDALNKAKAFGLIP